MGGRIWRTKPNMLLICRPERYWRSRCRKLTKGTPQRFVETLAQAGENVAELIAQEAEKATDQKPKVHVNGIEEVVADKGYHSGAVLAEMKRAEVRTYIPEKKQRGQRDWDGKQEQQRAVYANRQRVNRAYGQRLLRKRGALIERSFAH